MLDRLISCIQNYHSTTIVIVSVIMLPVSALTIFFYLFFCSPNIISMMGALGLSTGVTKLNNKQWKGGQEGPDGIQEPNDCGESTVVILFYKPENVLTSHVSEDNRSTVYDEVQSMKGYVRRIHNKDDGKERLTHTEISFQQETGITSKLNAIGRLDADTSGLLLLTNDGGLVHHVTNPNAATHTDGAAITKTYEALIMGHHNEESLRPLWEGVDIGSKNGGVTLPVNDLKILDHPNHKSTLVSLTISEGRNRQVRRMFHSLGSGVMKLKRTKIGDYLSLDGLDVGQWRILSNNEVFEHLKWEPRKLSFVSKTKHKNGTKDTAAKKDSVASRTKSRKYNRGKRRRS